MKDFTSYFFAVDSKVQKYINGKRDRTCLQSYLFAVVQSVVPFYKKGKESFAVNYRPISLIFYTIEVFEKLVRSRITHSLEDNNLLNSNQHSFRGGWDCPSQLLRHFDVIIKALREGPSTDVIYLDFHKAFDRVDHKIQLKKRPTLDSKENCCSG